MKKLEERTFIGERALFNMCDLEIRSCKFCDGESPLKECKNIIVSDSVFDWKYPLWYSKDIKMTESKVTLTGRAGFWYSENMSVKNCEIIAPKSFRRSSGLVIEKSNFENAEETLWHCKDLQLRNVVTKGNYFAMNSENIEVDGLELDGDYSFDGCKNVVVKNSRLISKDAFWNCENVIVENTYISGEYLAWNVRNIKFINCTLESLQGLCYVENLVLENCKTPNTTLAFEYSSVNAKIIGEIESVINPKCGIIQADSIGNLIMDETKINPHCTKIYGAKSEIRV